MLFECENTSTLQCYNQSSSAHRISYPKFDLDTKTTLLITNSTDSSQTLSGFAKIQQKFQLKSTNSNERNRSQTADNSVVHMNSTVHVLQSEKNITTPPPTKCDFAHGSEQKSPFWCPSLDNKKVIKPHLPYRRWFLTSILFIYIFVYKIKFALITVSTKYVISVLTIRDLLLSFYSFFSFLYK